MRKEINKKAGEERPGKVLLKKPYKKPNGKILPAGRWIVFDLDKAKQMIRDGLAVKWTVEAENAMLRPRKKETRHKNIDLEGQQKAEIETRNKVETKNKK
jgi:hypothetical protein